MGRGGDGRVRVYCLRSDLSETVGVERLPGKGHALSALYVGERLKVRERFDLRCGSAFLKGPLSPAAGQKQSFQGKALRKQGGGSVRA